MSIRSNVDARNLDQRVRVDRKQQVQDPNNGEMIVTWVSLGEFWASVDGTKASGAEATTVDGIRTVSDYTVWMRADLVQRLNLTVLDRLFWAGAPYNIADMPNQQLRGRLVALIVRTGENAG